MSWIDKLNLEQSIVEIKSDEQQGKDFCLDPLRFEDLTVRKVRAELLTYSLKRLRGGKFEHLIEIDVPKQNYLLRPASRPPLVDWVSYNAVVNYIGGRIIKRIPEASFSFKRFKNKFNEDIKHKSRIDYWLDFENEARLLAKKNSYMLVTDIVSFFEHISLDVLRDRLLLLSRSDKDYHSAVSFLVDNLLHPWTEKNKIEGFGLPQGPTASVVLADIFLYPVDRGMMKRRIPFIRYNDDIRIFTKNRQDLKKYLAILTKELRVLKLNLNTEKTRIYITTGNIALDDVFDPKKETLDLIDKAVKSRIKSQIRLVLPSLLELLRLSKNPNTPFNERYLKFFISRMIDLMKFGVIEKSYINRLTLEFLEMLEEKHNLSNLLCWFLVAAQQYHKSLGGTIKGELIKFILDKNKNIYDWQEMWALDTIRQIGGIRRREINLLKKYTSKHELCQAQLCLIQAQDGSADDREEILEKIKSGSLKNDQYRYYFTGVQELHKKLLTKAGRRIPQYFKEYIYSLKGNKYGFQYYLGAKRLASEQIEYY